MSGLAIGFTSLKADKKKDAAKTHFLYIYLSCVPFFSFIGFFHNFMVMTRPLFLVFGRLLKVYFFDVSCFFFFV